MYIEMINTIVLSASSNTGCTCSGFWPNDCQEKERRCDYLEEGVKEILLHYPRLTMANVQKLPQCYMMLHDYHDSTDKKKKVSFVLLHVFHTTFCPYSWHLEWCLTETGSNTHCIGIAGKAQYTRVNNWSNLAEYIWIKFHEVALQYWCVINHSM